MPQSQQKITQYLGEAHAMEVSLRRVLESQIAVTPRGRYRGALEDHLAETRDQASRIRDRQRELGGATNPLRLVVDIAEAATGQALALAKTPIDLVRGSGGDEKVLKNAKDACATEALEIATYTALESLARALGDEKTADLAVSIREEEEAMLATITEQLPDLAERVAAASEGSPSYKVSETGAADAVRAAGREARKVPGVATAEGQARGLAASEEDLPITGYDDLNASDVVSRLDKLSKEQLGEVDAYERRHEDRVTITRRISSLREGAPA